MKFLVSSGMASSQLWPSADQRVVPAFATSEIGVLPLGALYEIFLHLSGQGPLPPTCCMPTVALPSL
jgi:hypothetical protein